MKSNLGIKDSKILVPINLRLFGEGDGGGDGPEGGEGSKGDAGPKGNAGPDMPDGSDKGQDTKKKLASKPPDDSNSKKYEAQIKKLEKQIEAMQKEKMSAEELKKFEDEKRTKEFAEKEAELKDRENKLYAVKAINDIGIDCGSDDLSVLTSLVTTGVESAEEIDERLNSVKKVIDEAVKAECERRFKDAGRTPKGAGKANETEENDIAKKLGARRAESDKKAKSILDYYTKR